MRKSRNKNQAAKTDMRALAPWGAANFDNDAAMERARAQAEELRRGHRGRCHLPIPYRSSDGQDRSVTMLEVDRISLRSPAIWIAVSPEHWSMVCFLSTLHGWTLPRPARDLASNAELTFTVRGESATELATVLDIIISRYTDRVLRECFGRNGWKAKLGSLASFFASRGAAIFVCHSIVQSEDADD
jgi:hypothetical protein